MKSINVKKIGQNIAERRAEVGINQCDLADMLQVHRQQIARWETGIDMQISNLYKVASALGLEDPLRLLDGVKLESADGKN